MTASGDDLELVELRLGRNLLEVIDERAENALRTREQMLELLISIGMSASEPLPEG
jgi:hypothetical protein